MLLSNVQPLNPVAFEIFGWPIYWYGVIIILGALLGYVLANREAIRRGLPKDFFADLLIWAVPVALIFARMYYVIFNLDYYLENPGQIIAIWEGGLAIHGGLVGGVLTGYVFAKIRGYSFWKVADIAAPSILLGQAIGRWGNFINQEAHGGEVSRQFLENLMLPDWIINQMFIDGSYYHPTFLYESIWSFIGVGILLYLRRVNMRRGELFLTYVIWYSFGRFFIEGLRTDSLMIFDLLRAAQVISIVLIVGGVITIIYRRKTGLSRIRYLSDDPPKKKNKKKNRKKNKNKK
ncbi:phosphatidylglycerol:prolipoprotein diacylglycerol transferase [Geomicrobium halophilum]|uniref:Phosphatidylglycerol--prolipoprotein diacylglyceryl transferase n=1 Tax=Geomicrobium halophilum TaxID=549000 RepID=A0A841PM38_9BACL|nr:phosphatidylglycerol:prolipoprotein diacylglycerol transferase [Geomicrobium halophilum]